VVAVMVSTGPTSGARPVQPPSDGQSIFRFDTFGDEQFWTETLQLHAVIESSVSPIVALGVGLKVDAAALPPEFLNTHDLDDSAITVERIRLNAVGGLVRAVSGTRLKSVGITCAICHSTVDDSVAPFIGHRLDGWANRDLDPGAIIALSPVLTASQRAVYSSWGPGDPQAAKRGEVIFKGKAACAACHVPPTFPGVLSGPDPSVPFLHDPDAVGTEPVYASRSATKQYRTTPLRALWAASAVLSRRQRR
jgi:hypothetical protein